MKQNETKRNKMKKPPTNNRKETKQRKRNVTNQTELSKFKNQL